MRGVSDIDLRGPATDAVTHLIDTGLAEVLGQQFGKGIAAGMQRSPAEQAAPELINALTPFAEIGANLTDLLCHRGLVGPEKCSRCGPVLFARAALRSAGVPNV